MNVQDPRLISQNDLPLIVLSEQKNSFISFIIDWRTKGSFDHAMLSINCGKFACQSFSGYAEVDMKDYFIKGGQLRFIKLVNGNESFNQAFRSSVLSRLASPWYHKMYDFLGIFGQAIGQPWIHTPGLEYCSVDVIRHLKNAAKNLPDHDCQLILSIPAESSPQDLDNIICAHPEVFSIYGEWEGDIDIIK